MNIALTLIGLRYCEITQTGGGHWHAAIALTTSEPVTADQPAQLRGRQDRLEFLTRDHADKSRVPASKRCHSQPAHGQIVFSSDFAGRLVEISTAYYAYTGCKPIAPSHWIVFPAIHKRDKASVRAGWQAAINEGGAFTADFRLLGVDGGSRWFRLHSTPSLIVSGVLRSWSSICIDIDDLKREHLVLRASEARARRKCADQHAILMMWHKLQSELSAAAELHAVGRLAATLAHELNQPLTAASNYARAAAWTLESAGEAGRAVAAVAADNAVEQVLRAGAIVRNLRDYASAIERHRTPEPLCLVLEKAAALALIGADYVGVRIRSTLAVKRHASINRIQVQQVLINLVRNAIEAMQMSPDPALDLDFDETLDGLAVISVADRGPGIATELAGRMFSPCASTKPQGMGLGLSICRTIVEAHGGSIWVEEPVGGGAIFRFTLPVIQHD
ncbi:ATP-binding protein [Sphingomonas faeni]